MADSSTETVRGRRIVITGANGFVGRAVGRWFVERGANVVGCVRRPEAGDSLPRGVAPLLIADLHDQGLWANALREADAVVHLVARTHVVDDGPERLPEYRRTNVDITRTLLRAAIDRDVRRFVFVSSIKAVGEGSPEPYTESTPCRPRDAYGVTKREAELLVHGECWGTRTEPVVLRPPLVYGPGVKGNLERLIRAVDRGLPLPLGRVRGRRSLVHVDNLADAVGTATAHENAAARTLHVADDGPPPTVRELVERIARCLGRPSRLLPVPEGVLHLAGRLLRKSSQVDRLTGSLVVSTADIRRHLGWRAPVELEDGLRQTVQWYRRRSEGLRRAA